MSVSVYAPPCSAARGALGVDRRRSRDGPVARASVGSKSGGANCEGREFLLSRNTRRELILGMGLSMPMLLGTEVTSADPVATVPSAKSKTGATPSRWGSDGPL